jgi:hypothetical protein
MLCPIPHHADSILLLLLTSSAILTVFVSELALHVDFAPLPIFFLLYILLFPHTELAQHGVLQGERVSILMSNVAEYPLSLMAILGMGAVAVTLNGFWEGPMIKYGLEDSGTKVLIADDKRLQRLTKDGMLEELLANGLKVLVIRPSVTYPDGVLDYDAELAKHEAAPSPSVDGGGPARAGP